MTRILVLLNQVIYRNMARIRDDKNMTMAIVRYRDQEFNVVGQHESVLICRNDGTIEDIDTLDLGLPLGLVDDIEDFVALKQFKLNPGDVMVLYSDGITEAEDDKGEQYTFDKMTNALLNAYEKSAKEIRDHLIDDVYDFIGETKIYDDISLMVLKQK